MKKLMKFISCIMVFILLASVSGAAFAADSSQLMFSSSGDFVILQFADCQDVYPAREAMVTFINEALDNVQPNLVVFTGDNVVTDNLMAFDEILNPVVSRGLPFTFCFGN
ncbi:MAG TPA: hypothetical protein PKN28_07750, partial [Clostridiales bacterium]|nr:hypothetical protein [Clostridiales bacterium]